jgi:tryptophan synthase beta chain
LIRHALLALLLLACPRGWAAGFGPLVHQSDLGRPLDVEIQLLVPAPADAAANMEVSIADDQVYTSMGLTRPAVLNTASILLEPGGTDSLLVHVRTRQTVMEPFLPLILELRTSGGVLRREYDMLMDPPRSGLAGAAAPSGVAAAPGGADRAGAAGTEDQAKAESAPQTKSKPQKTPRAASTAAFSPARESAPIAAAAAAVESTAPAPPAPPQLGNQAGAGLWRLDTVLHEIPQAPMPPSAPLENAATTGAPASATVASAAGAQPTDAQPTGAQSTGAQPAGKPEPGGGRSAWSGTLLLAVLLAGLVGWRIERRLRRTRSDAAAAPEAPPVPQPSAHTEAPAPPAPRIVAQSGATGTRQPEEGIEIEVIDSSNFYDEVAELLESVFAQDPQRLDLAQKLVEVYTDADQPDKLRSLRQRLAAPCRPWDAAARDEVAALFGRIDQRLAQAVAAPGDAPPPGPSSFNRHYEGAEFEGLEQQLATVREAYQGFRKDAKARRLLTRLINAELGRPSALQPALRLGEAGGAKIYFKRDDLRLLGSELAINLIGQMHLMQAMGKTEVAMSIESVHGAGVVLLASRALNLPATVYVWPELLPQLDKALLAEARKHGVVFLAAADSRDPRRDALSAWLRRPDRTGYVTGLRAGPDPYPSMVMDFTSIFGQETRQQLKESGVVAPAAVIASARAGFCAIGFVKPFIERQSVRIIMTDPPPGLTGGASATPEGDPWFAWREHRWLQATGRVEYVEVKPALAAAARVECDRVEEFMPQPEDASSVGIGLQLARELPPDASVVIQLNAAGAT